MKGGALSLDLFFFVVVFFYLSYILLYLSNTMSDLDDHFLTKLNKYMYSSTSLHRKVIFHHFACMIEDVEEFY